MKLHDCLKKMGLSGHEAAIIRGLISEEKGAPQAAAMNAVRKRLAELKQERKDVLEQAQERQSGKATAQSKVEEASKEAAHSPENAKPLPTPAQHEAGNYPKGHVHLLGLNISIENPKGSVRSGVADGKPWQVKMQNAYGYIRGTKGKDKEHIDVYLGEHLSEDTPVFVIDQIDPATKRFDEHKTVLGARGYSEAKAIYDDHFADDSRQERRGAVSKMSLPEFKEWLKGDTTKPVKYKEPTSKAAGADERLNNPEHRAELEAMAKEAGWAEIGGRLIRSEGNTGEVTGRTQWIPRAAWWPERPDNLNDRQVQEAVRKALAGEPLSAAEKRTVAYMLDRANENMKPTPSEEFTSAELAASGVDELSLEHARQALELADEHSAKPDNWSTMSEGEKNAHLDAIFGEDSSPTRKEGGAETPAPETRPALELAAETPEEVKTKEAAQEAAEEKVAQKAAAPPPEEFALSGSQRAADEAVARGQRELAPPAAEAVERFAGQYKKGLSEFVAKQQLRRLEKERPELDWRVEAAPQHGEQRFEVAGYEKPKFARGEGAGLDRVILDPIVSRIRAAFPHGAEVETLGSMAEAPKVLLDRIKAINGAAAVQAAWWQGKVYVFPENIGSVKDAEFALLHEFGHDGMRKLFGARLDPLLKSIYDGNVKVQLEVAKLRKEFPDLSITRATEEHLANIAGSGEQPTWMGKVISFIRDFLRTNGFVSKFSDNDILNIVHASRGALIGKQEFAPAGIEPVFARKETVAKPTIASELANRTMPDWVSKMEPAAQEALRKAGVWAPKQTLKQRWQSMKQEAGQKILQGTVDQFAPVLKKIGDYPYKLLRMASSADAGLEASLEFGRLKLNSEGALTIIKGTKGFLEIMKPLQGEADRFFSWVAGNRAEQLTKEDREHLFGDADIAQLKRLNQKAHAADNFANGTDGSQRPDIYARVMKDYNEFSKSILDIAENAGIIDGEKRALWEKEFYVPFFREADDKVTGPGNLSGMVNQYAFKKLKGGEGVLHDLLANTMQNWSHLLNASLKNNAARETLEQGAKLGIAHEVKTDEKGSVYILKDGQKVHYIVDDPLVLDAISSLGASPFKGPVMDALGKMKHILTVGTTASPVFRIRHTIREQIAALAANPTSYNFVKNWIDGFKYSSRNNPEYGNMLAGGSFFRMGMSLQDANAAYAKRLIAHGIDANTVLDTPSKVSEALKGAWDWWKETGERSDSITRANIYRQVHARLIAEGASEDKAHFEAAYAARDVMDYGLRGTWPALRMITQSVPFMNARMQGLYKLGRGAAADPRRFAAVVGGLTLATIALSLAYRNDPDFQQREEWDRDNNWWFKIGDKAVRVPKPFELGALATVTDRALETALNGFDAESRERFAKQLLLIAGSQLNLNPIPQAIWPAIQVWANKDVFTGRQIESQRDQNLSVANRAGPNTSAAARIIGKTGIISPEQTDFLVNAYLGWVGSHVVATADLALRPLMGMSAKPTPKVDDYFLIGDFVKDMPSNQSRFVEQFYNHLKTTQQAFGDMRSYQMTGQIEAAQEAAKTPDVQLAAMYRMAMTSIGRINQQVRMTQSADIDEDQKRQRLDRLYQLRNAIAKSVETTRNAKLQ